MGTVELLDNDHTAVSAGAIPPWLGPGPPQRLSMRLSAADIFMILNESFFGFLFQILDHDPNILFTQKYEDSSTIATSAAESMAYHQKNVFQKSVNHYSF